MEPFFLGYLLIPLGYTSALAVLSASAERALVQGNPDKAIRLLSWARKAPFLSTYRSMCDVNLITAAYSLERFDLVEDVWSELEPRLDALRPYAGSAIASYGATLIGRGRYSEAESLLRSPLQDPKPNQRPDNITVICRAFCRANLSSALINLGRLEEAQTILTSIDQELEQNVLLRSLHTFLTAYLAYLTGSAAAARNTVSKLDFNSLPLLYRTELRYHSATLLARCEDPSSGKEIIRKVDWDTSSHRKLVRLRTLASAEIASARGENKKALSYFKDLKNLGHRGALEFVRASALASRQREEELKSDFLRCAKELDPESHWAQVASKKLEGIEA